MPVFKRVYKAETLKVNGAEISVLRLVSSTKVSKKEMSRALDEMELSEYSKGTFIEYVVTEGNMTYRKAFGKPQSPGELAKWPVRLLSVAVLDELPENFNLNELKWHKVDDDIYVYEGKVRGAKAVMLNTEDGIYLVAEETVEGKEENWKREEG